MSLTVEEHSGDNNDSGVVMGLEQYRKTWFFFNFSDLWNRRVSFVEEKKRSTKVALAWERRPNRWRCGRKGGWRWWVLGGKWMASIVCVRER